MFGEQGCVKMWKLATTDRANFGVRKWSDKALDSMRISEICILGQENIDRILGVSGHN